MTEKAFYAKCIYATETVTAGKDYKVIEDNGNKISVLNDQGNKISLMRHRFDKIRMTDESVKAESGNMIICKNTGGFISITIDRKYKIERMTRDFYYISNDIGVIKRYGKKYFKVSSKEIKKPVSKKEMAVCIFPVLTELSFKKAYSFKDVNKDRIIVSNDKFINKEYLKKRFKIEMV